MNPFRLPEGNLLAPSRPDPTHRETHGFDSPKGISSPHQDQELAGPTIAQCFDSPKGISSAHHHLERGEVSRTMFRLPEEN